MKALGVSSDTSAFEVPAVIDPAGRLTPDCARQATAMIDRYGVVVLTGLLSDEEAAFGLDLVQQTIADPDRNKCAFASETDNRYLRRDFCSLPSTPPVVSFAATLCQRLEGVIGEYCGRSRPLLEVATFTSYIGSSHQYLHRDPAGVISLFAAFEDVSEEQGGTVFVPGTHMYGGAGNHHGGQAYALMERPLAPGEFRDRVFSSKWDLHQPNLLRFALGKNAQFSLRDLTLHTLWRLWREGAKLDGMFRLVQTAPRKGSVILYRSDLIHAGPDNRSPAPRRFFGMSIARDMIETKYWHDGYSPDPSLTANPLTFGDLLDAPALPRAPGRHLSAVSA